MFNLDEELNKCRLAQSSLMRLSNKSRNNLLIKIADNIKAHKEKILAANKIDIASAKANNITSAMLDRLTLTESSLNNLIKSVLYIASIDDVIGEIIESRTLESGCLLNKVRVPIGVIGVIFEARPNVVIDIASLCIKTSNAVVLKGGKEAINTNIALVEIMQEAIKEEVNPDILCLIKSIDREVTNQLILKKEYIDLLIPRGGKGLINFVTSNAKIPVIETGAGNCSLYVHEEAEINMAINIAINAKYQRPSVCNAIENIIVDKNIANVFLPKLYEEFSKLNIEMRGDEISCSIIPILKASEEDYYTEYNDYIVAIKVVENVDEAITFINEHNTKHSETIVTKNIDVANKFMDEIDAACIYHNASTRFTDGGCFGLGAEIGISTQKLHARGPMGLKEITTYKYKIYGHGEVRK